MKDVYVILVLGAIFLGGVTEGAPYSGYGDLFRNIIGSFGRTVQGQPPYQRPTASPPNYRDMFPYGQDPPPTYSETIQNPPQYEQMFGNGFPFNG